LFFWRFPFSQTANAHEHIPTLNNVKTNDREASLRALLAVLAAARSYGTRFLGLAASNKRWL
jgi:hypothetical protein